MKALPFERKDREILIRKNVRPSKEFGMFPQERDTEKLLDFGIVNINKPAGPTSHQVSAYVQKILNINKGGHSGTLDPKVTGVLPVAIGKATRIVQTLLIAGKEYVGVMHLHKEIDKETILEAFKKFTGKIKQLPPIKSAVKRQSRFRKIYYLELLDLDGQDVLFKVGCQAGTYIRKLCHDLGAHLGCGAHMSQLRRTKAGCFSEDTLCTLQDLTDAFWYYKNEGDDSKLRKLVMPIEKAVDHLPKVWALDSAVDTLCHGASLKIPGVAKVESEIQNDEMVAMLTLKDELIGIGTSKMTSREMIGKDRGLCVQTSKIFMDPSTYPRINKISDEDPDVNTR